MPQVKIQSVSYVSSEDPNYPAENLLGTVGKKWKCRDNGEQSVCVIMELLCPVKISGIDIGNEHSAFIEVLVSKKGAKDDYKEILLTSSFMTPVESRNSTTTNRVRCFADNALVEDVANEKWDLVKIVCTQPFNRHIQYGISFIKIHSSSHIPSKKIAPDNNAVNDSKGPMQIGKFKLREESPDSTDDAKDTSTSLFSRWKQNLESRGSGNKSPITAASAIREASSSPAVKPMINTKKISVKHSSYILDNDSDEEAEKTKKNKRNSSKILYEDSDDNVNQRLEDKLTKENDKKEKKKEDGDKRKHDEKQVEEKKKPDGPKDEPKRMTPSDKIKASSSKFKDFLAGPSTSSSTSSTKEAAKKRTSSPIPAVEVKKPRLSTPERPKMTFKPFKKLMEGVVLVISGIQNPDRSELRRKALEMGAKYKSDWDSQCTHLICAFKNTPKYNQVMGHGKIVNNHWIHESYAKKIRLPWRRHALDNLESKLPESDEEIFDLSMKPANENGPTPTTSKKTAPPEKEESYEDLIEADYDSGEDTEDEIDRVRKANGAVKDTFVISTDEDDATKIAFDPFYQNKKFYIDKSTVSSIDIIKLKNYIRMYKGEVVSDPVTVNYYITTKPVKTDRDFSGILVSPSWIYECHDMECLLSTKRFKIE